jgi:hypothetical protein
VSKQTPAQTLEYRKSRRALLAMKQRKWRANNADKSRKNAKNYRDQYPEKILAQRQKYKTANPGLAGASAAQKKARRLNLECECCTAKELLDFYNMSVLIGKQVDHIKAFRFRGLHCVQNLRTLTEQEHLEKTKEDTQLAHGRLL